MDRAQLEQLDAEAAVAEAHSDLVDERLRALASETPIAGMGVIRAQQLVEQAERRLSQLRPTNLDSLSASGPGHEMGKQVSARVVVAEDEAIVRLDLREILEEEGFEVVAETGRGDEALTLIRDLEPDLAILDIKMPGLDGLAVARQVAPERKTAVLILTAFSQRSAIEEARDAGAMAYLIKPFQRSELVPAVHVALARFREEQAMRQESSTVDDRKVVDQAKALLMDKHGLSEVDASEFLRGETDEEVSATAQKVVNGDLTPNN